MPNKYISQYTEKTDAISTDLFLIQRGSVYYKQKRSSLFAVLDGYIPLAGSSLITGDLKYTKGSAANFGTADNYGLNLITNNTTKVTIDNAGFVGINKTVPTASLEIVGSTDNGSAFALKVNNSTSPLLTIRNNKDTTLFYKELTLTSFTGSDQYSYIYNTPTSGQLTASDVDKLNSFAVNTGTTNTIMTCQVLSGTTTFTLGTATGIRAVIKSTVAAFAGIQEDSNYSANYTSLSLINKGFADGKYFAKVGDTITGTAGAGFVGIVAQSSNASAPAATGLKLFSASDGHFSWVVKNGSDTFVRKIGGALTADRAYTLPDATDTISLIATTQTLTNKRVTQRVGTVASSATPTINTDNVDAFSITALAVAITSFTTNLSGTPTDYQTLMISITDDGTARSIAWGASFESSTTILPTITIISQRLDVAFVWNTVTSKWRCIGTS